jgi:hypothetical protein
VDFREDMLEEKLQHIRYFKLGYGGQHYSRMINLMLDLVTFSNE